MKQKITDVRRYWTDRGGGYANEFKRHNFFLRRYFKRQEEILINLLKTETEIGFKTVLEVGCGFGRITELLIKELPDIEKYKAIDLSTDQIENAKKYMTSAKVEFSVGTIQDLDIPSESYDLVLASEVLMHIPFTEIETAIEQMVQVSKNHIINLDWYRQTSGVELGGYCFAHDYERLYKKYGCKVEVVTIPRRPIYTIGFGLDSGLSISKTHPETQRIWHVTKT